MLPNLFLYCYPHVDLITHLIRSKHIHFLTIQVLADQTHCHSQYLPPNATRFKKNRLSSACFIYIDHGRIHWKAPKIVDYSIQLDKHNANRPVLDRVLRESSTREWKEEAVTKLGRESFCRNAAKLWNNVSKDIKEAYTIYKAKKGDQKLLHDSSRIILIH